jgi:molecular chaperone GrpE
VKESNITPENHNQEDNQPEKRKVHSHHQETNSDPFSSAKSPAPSEEPTPEATATSLAEGAMIEELRKRIESLENHAKDKENKYVYLYADFDNFKKRSIKERSDLIKFGWEPVARDLLRTVDNLERALEHVPSGTDKNFVSGIQMVLEELKSTLQKQGIERIESVKKDFDPNLHEAVGQEESDLPSGKIVREHSGGYTLHGRLLRPARVVISQGR